MFLSVTDVLQGTLALFLQEHAPQLPPDMKSELGSMWHDIERLEFVLTDVLRMRTMDVVSGVILMNTVFLLIITKSRFAFNVVGFLLWCFP
jgi:hypothetical protein